MSKLQFPTLFHERAAGQVNDYFSSNYLVDTVLVVNSCARGQAVAESDLDFAILVKPGTSATEMEQLHADWQQFSYSQPDLIAYSKTSPFAHLHLDIIDGHYTPTILEIGVASDYFEVEIGNQICYSACMGDAGQHFQALRKKWLPYYEEQLRLQRLAMTRNACLYDLNHLPFLVKRQLHFHAFDILYKAFQEYLQVLFISHKIYPIAYNKWIKMQVVDWLNRPDLYARFLPVLSVANLESAEIVQKAELLRALLDELPTV